MSFEIKPLDAQVSQTMSNIPRIPFTLGIIAGKGGGKTTLLCQLLIKKEFYKEKFNQIYLLSPTAHNDSDKWNIVQSKNILIENKNIPKTRDNYESVLDKKEKFNKKLTEIHTDMDEYLDIINNISQRQQSMVETYGKQDADNVLIILDDCLGHKLLKSNELMKMVIKSRHLKISMIIISQSYFGIHKTIRLNMSFWVLFHIANMKELGLIYEENNASFKQKEFESIFENITSKPFAFLCINHQNNTQHKLINSFKTFIIKKISN